MKAAGYSETLVIQAEIFFFVRLKQADRSGRSLAGIVGLNSGWGMDVCFCECYVLYRYKSVRVADPSSRVALPCMCVCVRGSLRVIRSSSNLPRVGRCQTRTERKKDSSQKRTS
jgi:hypothetical protein